MLLDRNEAAHPSTVAAAADGQRRAVRPGLIAAIVYSGITLGILIASWHAAERHFVYPVDDSYIGMAMAKNLALHGVWGVSRYGFSSSDSSLLFPLLLAGAYRIGGVNQYAPVVLSWIFGLASIFIAERMLAHFLRRKAQTWALILFVLLPPLFVVGILGMEHSLHLLLTLLFLEYFLKYSTGDPEPEPLWKIGTITALMVAARYEGLFFVAPACCILVLGRRWKAAATIVVSAAIPVAAYAAYSLAHGAYWLPNSVALKGAENGHASIFGAAHEVLARIALNGRDGVHMPLLLGAMAAAALALLPHFSRRAIPLLLVLGAGCLHMGLASIGWVFRYEDYLIGAAVVALACAAPALVQSTKRWAFTMAYLLMLASGASLLLRSASAAHLLPVCSRCIYAQQWQMAHFLRRFYPHGVIAANDIGAIDDYNEIHCFDLLGLANQDVFFARRSGRYTTEFLQAKAAAAHVQIAIVYDDVFGTQRATLAGPALPRSWVRVGRWSIEDHVVLVEKTVSFYAVDPAEAPRLRAALASYTPSLPKNVAAEEP
jgi:hypothetical protein